MSRLLKAILMIASGGVAKLEYRKIANILSDYNLCSSVPFEKLVAQLTSLATLSMSEVRLVASPSSVITMLSYLSVVKLYPSPTSVYSLSTVLT